MYSDGRRQTVANRQKRSIKVPSKLGAVQWSSHDNRSLEIECLAML